MEKIKNKPHHPQYAKCPNILKPWALERAGTLCYLLFLSLYFYMHHLYNKESNRGKKIWINFLVR